MTKPKIISITALKGGTGKTIITFNVATLLATKYNKKVLVIDIDPQHNMSNLLYKTIKRKAYRSSIARKNMNSFSDSEREYTTEDIFEFGTSAMGTIKKSHIKNVDIIPTTISLTATELQISGLAGRELILKNWMYDNKESLSHYDYVFLDTNPTMSIVNTNAFICCHSIVLASDIDLDSILASKTFMELYYPIQNRIDRQMSDNIKGLIINKVKDSNNLTRDFIEYVESDSFEFSDILLKNKIHDAIAISETKVERQPIQSSRNERSYDEFIALIDEMLEKGVL